VLRQARNGSKGNGSHYLRTCVLVLVPRRCQLLATTPDLCFRETTEARPETKDQSRKTQDLFSFTIQDLRFTIHEPIELPPDKRKVARRNRVEGTIFKTPIRSSENLLHRDGSLVVAYKTGARLTARRVFHSSEWRWNKSSEFQTEYLVFDFAGIDDYL
jgi:hypothetical protein